MQVLKYKIAPNLLQQLHQTRLCMTEVLFANLELDQQAFTRKFCYGCFYRTLVYFYSHLSLTDSTNALENLLM